MRTLYTARKVRTLFQQPFLLIAGCIAACAGTTGEKGCTDPCTPGQPGCTEPPATIAQYKVRMRDVLTLPNVVFLDDNAACSCVLVGIANATTASSVQNFAASKGVPAAVVKTVQSPRYMNRQSLHDTIRPIKGGLEISSGPVICTMMATVFHHARAKKGMITNSHCTATRNGVDGTEFFQRGGALFRGDFVGAEVIDPALTNAIAGCPAGRMCRRSDAALVEFHPNTLGTVGQLALPKHMCGTGPCDQAMTNTNDVLTIVGIGGAALAGENRHKIGRTTGWTRGLVTNDCIDINVSNDDGSDSNVTMICQNIVGASAGHGDSGSPVFELLQNNRVTLAGIMWGGSEDESSFVFTALPDVEAELGAMDFF